MKIKLFKFFKDRKYNIFNELKLIKLCFKNKEYTLIYNFNWNSLRYKINTIHKGYITGIEKHLIKVY